MKEGLKKFLLSAISGVIGVGLTIGYQHFFSQIPSFTFIIDGKEVILTETELQEQLDMVQTELESKKSDLTLAEEELAILKKQVEDVPDIEFSNIGVNIDGESKNEYENGFVIINGKKFI